MTPAPAPIWLQYMKDHLLLFPEPPSWTNKTIRSVSQINAYFSFKSQFVDVFAIQQQIDVGASRRISNWNMEPLVLTDKRCRGRWFWGSFIRVPGEVRDQSEFLSEHFDFLRRTAILWPQIQVIDSHTRSKGGQEGAFCLLSFFLLKTSKNSFCRMPLGAMFGTQLPGRLGKSIYHPCSL